MPIISLDSPGEVGLVSDILPHELPMGVWSAGQNVRFDDGYAKKFTGHSQVFGAPPIAPYAVFPVPTSSVYYWMYAGLAKVYVTDGISHFNLTRQSADADVDYSATANENWTGGVIGGIPVLSNGADDPQMWSPVSTSQRLTSLTYDATQTWADVSYKAGSLRPFKQFLVALDVTKGADRFPRMVKWSHPADPGTVPATWDVADATKDAGETELAETAGFCVDAAPMGDTLVIYKEDSAWGMQYIGGNSIFRFSRMHAFGNRGILAKRCAVDIDGRHVVLVRGPDLVVHDGTSLRSIVDGRWQKWLKNSIDSNNYSRSYLTVDYPNNEVWVCIPTAGQSFPNVALVWNWRDNTFGTRDLPGAADIKFGVVDPSEDTTWDADTASWDADTSTWNERTYNPTVRKLLIADPTNTKLYIGNNTNQFAGTNMRSYVERTGMMDFGQIAQTNDVKEMQRLWPRMDGTGSVSFYVGSQYQIGEPVTWDGPYSFTPGVDEKIDCRVAGKLLALRVESQADVSWKLSGLRMEVVRRSRY